VILGAIYADGPNPSLRRGFWTNLAGRLDRSNTRVRHRARKLLYKRAVATTGRATASSSGAGDTFQKPAAVVEADQTADVTRPRVRIRIKNNHLINPLIKWDSKMVTKSYLLKLTVITFDNYF
jgi:hypothetical protein